MNEGGGRTGGNADENTLKRREKEEEKKRPVQLAPPHRWFQRSLQHWALRGTGARHTASLLHPLRLLLLSCLAPHTTPSSILRGQLLPRCPVFCTAPLIKLFGFLLDGLPASAMPCRTGFGLAPPFTLFGILLDGLRLQVCRAARYSAWHLLSRCLVFCLMDYDFR